jgi:hypothetical protein
MFAIDSPLVLDCQRLSKIVKDCQWLPMIANDCQRLPKIAKDCNQLFPLCSTISTRQKKISENLFYCDWLPAFPTRKFWKSSLFDSSLSPYEWPVIPLNSVFDELSFGIKFVMNAIWNNSTTLLEKYYFQPCITIVYYEILQRTKFFKTLIIYY